MSYLVDTAGARRPRVLVVLDHYLPGHRAGGPIRTIAHLAEGLGQEFEFLVATADRDLGDAGPFTSVPSGPWVTVGNASVVYLPRRARTLRGWRRVLREVPFDVLYLNSVFSRNTIRILVLRALGWCPARPVLLAPRGELSPGALGLKPLRKRAYLRVARLAGLFRGLIWRASTEVERGDVLDVLTRYPDPLAWWVAAPRDRVYAGVELARLRPAPAGPVDKQPGRADLVFLSRITRKKNLDYALRVLQKVAGRVHLAIVGPAEDRDYWEACRALIARLPPNVTVAYRGAVDHEAVPGVFAAHHLFLFPTRSENFGHVIVEALCAGCPVLVSDQTPWRDLERQQAGWDLPLDAPDAYRDAVERVVAMDAVEMGRWSNGAAALGRRISEDPWALETNRQLLRLALGMSGPAAVWQNNGSDPAAPSEERAP